MENRVGIFLTMSMPETHRDHGVLAAKEKKDDDEDDLDIVSGLVLSCLGLSHLSRC
jgi:hypothetical protein